MSESRPKKRKIEFIESYWTGGELGSDYQWNDNHGELIRCKDCIHWDKGQTEECENSDSVCFHNGWCKPDWFCAEGERRDDNA